MDPTQIITFTIMTTLMDSNNRCHRPCQMVRNVFRISYLLVKVCTSVAISTNHNKRLTRISTCVESPVNFRTLKQYPICIRLADKFDKIDKIQIHRSATVWRMAMIQHQCETPANRDSLWTTHLCHQTHFSTTKAPSTWAYQAILF